MHTSTVYKTKAVQPRAGLHPGTPHCTVDMSRTEPKAYYVVHSSFQLMNLSTNVDVRHAFDTGSARTLMQRCPSCVRNLQGRFNLQPTSPNYT